MTDAQGSPPVSDREKARQGQRAIARLAAPIRTKILIGQILTIVSAILAVTPYIALVLLGDLLLGAHSSGTTPDKAEVDRVVIILISAYTGRLFLYFLALLITHLADVELRNTIRRDIVERLARTPLAWFTSATSGRIRKAIQDDTTAVHTVIAHGPIERLNAIVSPMALLACAFWIDWRLALLSIATIPLYIATYSLTMRGMNEKTVEMDRRMATVSSRMVEFVAGISVVKAFGRVGHAHRAYINAAEEFSTFFSNWSLPLISISCASLTWVSIPVLLLVNLGGGALMINAGMVTVPQVLATTLIALVLPGAFITVVTISWAYQLAGAAALRLCDILDTEILSTPDAPKTPTSYQIDIDHVSFSYKDNVAVDDVTLTLEEGTVTALLGPSGSGKSTLASLIARFADPDSGTIRIGGIDLRDMTDQTLYQTVSFVLQDAQLLAAPIRDNIALARHNASLEDIRAAARIARIDEFIESLPHGYDTVLGTQTDLSGGQQQRIAIARAILADTPVILLDEATAMADPESEAEIQEALSALVAGRTVLVIAHRPAAVRGANTIVVMDRGRIAAAGTHEDLLSDPHYRALLRQSTTVDLSGAPGAASALTSDAEPAVPTTEKER